MAECTASSEDEDAVKMIARAIARADERNGGAPYEHRITISKHSVEMLMDEAREVLADIKAAGWRRF